MAILPFVVDEDFPWPPQDIDHGRDAEELARLIDEVKRHHLVRRLAEISAFREDLIITLSRDHIAPRTEQSEEEDTQSSRLTSRPPVFHAVPAYVGSAPFTGRSADLAVLDSWGKIACPVIVVEAIGGTGKSALTWQWAIDRAPMVIDGLAGRLWWSFYEGSASFNRFLQELLVYMTGRPMTQVKQLQLTSLADQVVTELRRRPYLVVLDGLERLLAAYRQFDPSEHRDEEVEPNIRSFIEPHAEEVLRQFTTAGPSKFVISTRLMPLALQNRFGTLGPGVQHLLLPGLSDSDISTLLAHLGVNSSGTAIVSIRSLLRCLGVDNRLEVNSGETAMTRFFRPLGNHPLLVGIVAGLVRDYRAEPGGFDRWLADPKAGAAFSASDLNLTQRRTHILAAALEGLGAGPRQLLAWISVLHAPVTWDVLAAINPFLPEPPVFTQPDPNQLGPAPNSDEQSHTWSASAEVRRAQAQLDVP